MQWNPPKSPQNEPYFCKRHHRASLSKHFSFTGDPLFPGESDIDQLFQITKLMGPLASKHRQIISKNPMFNGLSAPTQSQKNLKSLFPQWTQESLSFLKICLNLEPGNRSNCTDLLKSPIFTHDNFHISFPNQLRGKIQYEFGNQPIGTHKRISANKKQVNKIFQLLSQLWLSFDPDLSQFWSRLVSVLIQICFSFVSGLSQLCLSFVPSYWDLSQLCLSFDPDLSQFWSRFVSALIQICQVLN